MGLDYRGRRTDPEGNATQVSSPKKVYVGCPRKCRLVEKGVVSWISNQATESAFASSLDAEASTLWEFFPASSVALVEAIVYRFRYWLNAVQQVS